MEKRVLNLIVNKDGHNNLNYKINVPKKWIDKMGLSEVDRKVLLEFKENYIVIKKENK